MNQKTAIVTGGGRGIGAATAKLLAKSGFNVVLTYHKRSDTANEVVKSIVDGGGEASVFHYDAAMRDRAEKLAGFAVEQYGKIDLLVNNAGISHRELMTYTTDEDWENIIDVNLSGVFYLSRSVVPFMLKAGRGCIVNVSSIYGISGGAMETAYSAAKAGVIGFSKALAKELAPSGITVNCVAPGAIETEMNAHLSETDRKLLEEEIPLGRLGEPEEIADTILFLANNRYMTGQVISPNGGIEI